MTIPELTPAAHALISTYQREIERLERERSTYQRNIERLERERDQARAERDDALKQRKDLADAAHLLRLNTGRIDLALGTRASETTIDAAKRVVSERDDTIKERDNARDAHAYVVKERDQARAERDATLRDRLGRTRAALGAAEDESTVDAAQRVVAEREMERLAKSAAVAALDAERRDRVERLAEIRGTLDTVRRDRNRLIDDDRAVRAVLGAAQDETTIDAAKRVVSERDQARADRSAQSKQFSELCDALKRAPGETPLAAAKRVVSERDEAERKRTHLGAQLLDERAFRERILDDARAFEGLSTTALDLAQTREVLKAAPHESAHFAAARVVRALGFTRADAGDDQIRAALGAAKNESTLDAAKRVVAERTKAARDLEASHNEAAFLRKHLAEVRTALGAAKDESTAGAAKRVVAERVSCDEKNDLAREAKAVRDLLGALPGQTALGAVHGLRAHLGAAQDESTLDAAKRIQASWGHALDAWNTAAVERNELRAIAHAIRDLLDAPPGETALGAAHRVASERKTADAFRLYILAALLRLTRTPLRDLEQLDAEGLGRALTEASRAATVRG